MTHTLQPINAILVVVEAGGDFPNPNKLVDGLQTTPNFKVITRVCDTGYPFQVYLLSWFSLLLTLVLVACRR